jgi:hypothetical protein
MTAAKTKAKSNGAAPNREQGRRYVRSRHVKTVFEDGGEFDGLWIRTKRITVRQLFALSRKADSLPAEVSQMDADQLDEAETMMGEFADFLVSWNLDEPVLDTDGEETDESTPVPPTLDGLMSQDFGLVFTLFTTWIGALGSVPAPLDQTSSAGVPSAVPSTLPPVVPLPSPES